MNKRQIKEKLVAAVENILSSNSSAAPVFCFYPMQSGPQEAYLRINEDGLDFTYSGIVGPGRSPVDQYRRRLNIEIPPLTSREGFLSMLNRGPMEKIADLIYTILNGHYIEVVDGTERGFWNDEDPEWNEAVTELQGFMQTFQLAESYRLWSTVCDWTLKINEEARAEVVFHEIDSPEKVICSVNCVGYGASCIAKAAMKLEEFISECGFVVFDDAKEYVEEVLEGATKDGEEFYEYELTIKVCTNAAESKVRKLLDNVASACYEWANEEDIILEGGGDHTIKKL